MMPAIHPFLWLSKAIFIALQIVPRFSQRGNNGNNNNNSNQGGTSAQNLDVRSAMIVWAKGFFIWRGGRRKSLKVEKSATFLSRNNHVRIMTTIY